MMTKRPPSVEAISLLSILLIHHVGFAGSSDADKTIVYIFFQRIVSNDYWVVQVNILLINHDLLYLQETNTHKSVLQDTTAVSPKTGDNGQAALWITLLILSCGALTAVGIRKKVR